MNCEKCGEQFALKRKHQRFCSPRCRYQACQKRNYSREYSREWRRRNAESCNKRQRDYDYANPASAMYRSVKHRSKKLKIPFDITVDDIVIPKECPVLKIPMVKGTRTAPSVDRKCPADGYVKGNIMVMSKVANTMKNDASPTELKRFAKWVLKTYPL